MTIAIALWLASGVVVTIWIRINRGSAASWYAYPATLLLGPIFLGMLIYEACGGFEE